MATDLEPSSGGAGFDTGRQVLVQGGRAQQAGLGSHSGTALEALPGAAKPLELPHPSNAWKIALCSRR